MNEQGPGSLLVGMANVTFQGALVCSLCEGLWYSTIIQVFWRWKEQVSEVHYPWILPGISAI